MVRIVLNFPVLDVNTKNNEHNNSTDLKQLYDAAFWRNNGIFVRLFFHKRCLAEVSQALVGGK